MGKFHSEVRFQRLRNVETTESKQRDVSHAAVKVQHERQDCSWTALVFTDKRVQTVFTSAQPRRVTVYEP